MTWLDALGLALALFGVVVLLEWAYNYILGLHARGAPPLSVVVRVTNQEGQVEHAVRELERYFGNGQWARRPIDVVFWDSGSRDQTEAILERMARKGWFRVVEAVSADEVLLFCRHPMVVWLDCTRLGPENSWMEDLHKYLARKTAAE